MRVRARAVLISGPGETWETEPSLGGAADGEAASPHRHQLRRWHLGPGRLGRDDSLWSSGDAGDSHTGSFLPKRKQNSASEAAIREVAGTAPADPAGTCVICLLPEGWGLGPLSGTSVPPREAWTQLQTRFDGAVAPGFSQLSRAGRTGTTHRLLGLQAPGRVLPRPPTLPEAPSSAPGACSAAWAFLFQAPISAPGHFLMSGAPPLLTGTAGALGHLTSRPLRPGLWENSTQP